MAGKAKYPNFKAVLMAEAREQSRGSGHKTSNKELIKRIAEAVGRKPETVRAWQSHPERISDKAAWEIAKVLSAAKVERGVATSKENGRVISGNPYVHTSRILLQMEGDERYFTAAPELADCLWKVLENDWVHADHELQGRIAAAVRDVLFAEAIPSLETYDTDDSESHYGFDDRLITEVKALDYIARACLPRDGSKEYLEMARGALSIIDIERAWVGVGTVKLPHSR